MPAPDKIRPWIPMPCDAPGCTFSTVAEWELLRHIDSGEHVYEEDEPFKQEYPSEPGEGPCPMCGRSGGCRCDDEFDRGFHGER